MVDPVGAALHLLQSGVLFFLTLAPGGFGLLLIPLGALAIVSLPAVSAKADRRGRACGPQPAPHHEHIVGVDGRRIVVSDTANRVAPAARPERVVS